MTPGALKERELEIKKGELKEKELSRKQDKDLREKEIRTKRWANVGNLAKGAAALGFRMNDVSWYKKLKELFDVSTQIPSYYPNAQILRRHFIAALNKKLPEVLQVAFDDIWTADYDESQLAYHGNDTLNLAAQKLMAAIRAFNSRVQQYDPADLLQVIIAEIELACYILYHKRAYLAYEYFNEYDPGIADTFLTAMGFDANDFRTNQAAYKKSINRWIAEFNALMTIPIDFAYVQRKLLLSSVVYKEGNGDNDQFILPTKVCAYVYHESTGTLSNDIRLLQTTATRRTYSTANTQYATLLSGITNSTVLTTIIADLRSADLRFLQLDGIESNTTLEVRPVDEVLNQIMNATMSPMFNIVGGASFTYKTEAFFNESNSADGFMRRYAAVKNQITTRNMYQSYHALTQDTNHHLYEVSGATSSGATAGYKLYIDLKRSDNHVSAFENNLADNAMFINFYDKGKISGDDILEATRLTVPWKIWVDNDATSPIMYFVPQTAMSEVVLGIASWSTMNDVEMYARYIEQYKTVGGESGVTPTHNLLAYNYLPQQEVITGYSGGTEGSDTWAYPNPTADLTQWSKVIMVNVDELTQINKMCFKSLFTLDHQFKPVK